MSVGRMRHRLQLQNKTVTADGGGSDELTSYKTFATVYGSIVAKSGGERLFGEQLQEPITHIITLRFRTDFTFKNRILYSYKNNGVASTRALNIQRVVNVGSRDRYLEVMCIEGVAT